MPTASPIITISTVPILQTTMVGAITYAEFRNILGIQVFKINSIFIQAESNEQINQPLAYNDTQVTGKGFQEVLKPKIDPYQYRASFVLDNKGKEIVLNGFSTIAFNLLPRQSISMVLCSDQKSLQDDLNKISKSNFDLAHDSLGNLTLFLNKKDCV